MPGTSPGRITRVATVTYDQHCWNGRCQGGKRAGAGSVSGVTRLADPLRSPREIAAWSSDKKMRGWPASAGPAHEPQIADSYIVRVRFVPLAAVAPTASSPADAMSAAPVRFRMFFARVISSDESQCTDIRTPPFFTRPS